MRDAEVAKDSDASLGTRATAAKDAVGDKFDEEKHSVRITSYQAMPMGPYRPQGADTDKKLTALLG